VTNALKALGDRLEKIEKRLDKMEKTGDSSPDTRFVSTKPAPAHLTVRLPEDARLYIDGTFCPLTSATRSFNTPTLEANREYYYNLRAEITRGGQTRAEIQRVVVAPGRRVTVEFKNFTPPLTARR
jgi:uncharacterized protein (TIGR03000 family)